MLFVYCIYSMLSAVYVLAIILFPETNLQLYSTTVNFCLAVEINNGNTTVKAFASLLAKHLFMKSHNTPHMFAHDYLLVYNCISILKRDDDLCVVLHCLLSETACMGILSMSYTVIMQFWGN